MLRLQNSIAGQFRGEGWTTTSNAVGQGLNYEVRFNTLVQGTGAGSDELIGLSLTDVADPNRWIATALYSNASGAARQFRIDSRGVGGSGFQSPAFAFADNTWYRLRLEAAVDGHLRAVVLSDVGVELASLSFGVTSDVFAGGFRAGIYQANTNGGTSTTDVAIDWARLDTTPAAPAPLVLDALTSGERTVATQRDLYSFTLAQDTLAVMDPRVDNGQLRWTLTGDRGQIGSLNFQQRSWDMGGNPVMRLAAGTYTLRIDGNTTGAYGFRLMDLSAATVLTPGTPLSDTLAPGNSTRAYRFDAAAGDRVYFDAQQASNGDSSWRLISPSGDQRWITGLTSDVDVTTLDQAGTWTLIVEGRRYQAASTNAFTVNVVPAVTTTTDITFGQTVGTGARWGAGAPALGSGTALEFDGLRWLGVTGPATNLRNDLTLEAWIRPEAYATTWTPIALKGDELDRWGYELWLNNSGFLWWGTRDAAGRQNIVTAAGSIQLDRWTHVAAVIDRSAATPQLRVYLDGVLAASGAVRSSAGIDVSTPLYIGGSDPANRAVDTAFDGAIDELRLWSVARTQAQIIADRNAVPAAPVAGLSLRLPFDEGSGNTVADAGPFAAGVTVSHLLGDTPGVIAGLLATPGQTDRYRFTMAQDTRIVVDALTNSFGVVNWSLTGPDGLVAARNLNSTDSSNFFASYELAAGDYTLSIDASGDGVAAYGLRLIDLGAATLFTPGQAVGAELRPGSRTDAWAFDAVAGQSFYFDNLGAATSDGRWRLLDPLGRLVWETGLTSDVDTFSLALAGRYTLLAEGRHHAPHQANAYQFNLRPLGQAIVDIELGNRYGVDPGLAPGRIGQGFGAWGTAYASVPNGAAVDLRGDVTVEAWIRPERFSNTWMPIVVKSGDTVGSRTYSLWLNNGGFLHLSVADANGTNHTVNSPNGSVVLGQWTHIAGVIDRSGGTPQLRIYVNGVLAGTSALGSAAAAGNTSPLMIGTEPLGGEFDGVIEGAAVECGAQCRRHRFGPGQRARRQRSRLVGLSAVRHAGRRPECERHERWGAGAPERPFPGHGRHRAGRPHRDARTDRQLPVQCRQPRPVCAGQPVQCVWGGQLAPDRPGRLRCHAQRAEFGLLRRKPGARSRRGHVHVERRCVRRQHFRVRTAPDRPCGGADHDAGHSDGGRSGARQPVRCLCLRCHRRAALLPRHPGEGEREWQHPRDLAARRPLAAHRAGHRLGPVHRAIGRPLHRADRRPPHGDHHRQQLPRDAPAGDRPGAHAGAGPVAGPGADLDRWATRACRPSLAADPRRRRPECAARAHDRSLGDGGPVRQQLHADRLQGRGGRHLRRAPHLLAVGQQQRQPDPEHRRRRRTSRDHQRFAHPARGAHARGSDDRPGRRHDEDLRRRRAGRRRRRADDQPL
ncbi:LamG domain-containing protein [Ramlibacter sp. B156]|uniref:LamG domain-containing protein n=1 Tax=Ramlibacter montanisoli TaxID=2732512 RepID=A0A849KGG8_9BURK|nr:LamG domain-containing protein [Ramlibacter montanisoli]